MDEAVASTEEDKPGVLEAWPKDSIKDVKNSGIVCIGSSLFLKTYLKHVFYYHFILSTFVQVLDEKSFEKRTVVREWDLGKGDGRDEFLDRHNNRHRDANEVERRKRRTKSRSPSPGTYFFFCQFRILNMCQFFCNFEFSARKFKKKEEEAPSKLLDDLFKKTKATPCIYWLPLNAETVSRIKWSSLLFD